MKTDEDLSVDMMLEGLSRICETSKKPIVLMVDEVDSASNNQVFIDFLAQLRGYYLDRENQPTFRSVILAGVYDIKNLKLKLRPDEEHQYNSPWNIAADFDVDMSFSAGQIEVMLKEYETDHHAGMETEAVNILLKMNIPLFGSMAKQLDTYKDMRKMIEEAVYQGKRIPFIPTEKSINLGLMFCFLKEENGYVAVANRIFEMFLMNLFSDNIWG